MDQFSGCRLVDSIQFGIYSTDLIRNSSTVSVNTHISSQGGRPLPNGLNDPHLGTISLDYICETCNRNQTDCPGHFGHIELAEPFYHIGYTTIVCKVLQCVCHKCGRLLCDYGNLELQRIVMKYKGKQRFEKIVELVAKRKKSCKYDVEKKASIDPDFVDNPKFWTIVNGKINGDPNRMNKEPCGTDVPEVCMAPQLLVKYKTFSQATDDIIPPEKAFNVLDMIKDQDVRILGFDPILSHPRELILRVLPISPIHIRPPVSAPGSPQSQDDLTHKLADIVKFNNHLKKLKEDNAQSTTLAETRRLLQLHISTLMINDKPSITRATLKSGRPVKSISQRLKGKEGHIRGNLSGKRVDFSARSVISPDPSINIDQVGVPQELSKVLTFPEVVNKYNREWLQDVIKLGPDEIGGANYVISEQGTRFNLEMVQDVSSIKLTDGAVVHRHIRDNDIVIFNRQPSLHKMSMMGHRAYIMSGNTFRLNLCVTTPYNADFDGDEMNMHVPQSQTARAEVRHIMAVPFQIVSPQANTPVIGLVQDALLGCRLLSKRDTFLTRNQVMNLMMWIPNEKGVVLPPPAIFKPQQLWTGKQVFSMFLPQINLDAGSIQCENLSNESWLSPKDYRVIIRNGHLLAGILDKKTVARSEQSINHVVINSYSIDIAKEFLNQTQLIVNNWLENRGFSIGLIDCVTTKDVMNKVDEKLSVYAQTVEKQINEAMEGKLQSEPGLTLMETFEVNVNKVANEAINETGKLVQESSSRSNQLLEMVNAGSKGTPINISQIIACVGQQNVEGKRVRFGFRKRTLPHFTKDDLGLDSKGFCTHSYFQGLTPYEFFFHAMGGRVGIIDTACKTSDTGYIQRRLCKSMESHHVAYDGTVRNSLNQVIQFIYGGDGLDATGLETQTLHLADMSQSTFDNNYRFDIHDATFGQGYLDPQIIEEVQSSPDGEKVFDEELKRLYDFRDTLQYEVYKNGPAKVVLPINISRLIETSQMQEKINNQSSISDLNPINVVKEVEKTIESLIVIKGTDPISKRGQENATLLLRVMLYSNLSAKQVVFRHRLNKKAFEFVLGAVRSRFNYTIASPGEMVGTIAGQSIGEPSTQMTLNTFHFAGVSAKDVTLGVPRLNEIMNLAKSIKTPRVKIYLREDIMRDKDMANQVRASLEYTKFKKVVALAEIYYDPDLSNTVVDEDRDWNRAFVETADINSNFSLFVLRFELDRLSLIQNNLSVDEVANSIRKFHGSSVFVADFKGDEVRPPVIRINLIRDFTEEETKTQLYQLQLLERDLYDNLAIKGIKGINRVRIDDKDKLMRLDPVSRTFKKIEVCQLYTEGSVLDEILAHPDVNPRITTTNDVFQICETLGIEAARQALFDEMWLIIDSSGSKVNKRHLELLADTMTHFGEMRPVSRHGINKAPTGPLMKASFEKAVEVFFDAAAFSEVDAMSDISSNVIVGRTSRAGTGIVDVFIHEENLPEGVSLSSESGKSFMAAPTPDINLQSEGMEISAQSFIFSPVNDVTTASPVVSPFSPLPMSPMSPNMMSPIQSPNLAIMSPMMSPAGGMGYSPLSPQMYVPMSPIANHVGYEARPSYSPHTYHSPLIAQSPNSPLLGGTMYSDQSHGFSPQSPRMYNPVSPSYSPPQQDGGLGLSPQSPQSPLYNPNRK